jgi:hypothetical protein
MDEALDVKLINFKSGKPVCVVLTNDEMFGVESITCYDVDGDELPCVGEWNWDDLLWIVVGPTRDGHWLTAFVADYEFVRHAN